MPFSVAGCDQNDSDSGSRQDEAIPITFKDLDGRTITLPRPAERIVALVVPDAAMAIAVHGSPTRLVGIHPRARNMFAKSFVSEIFPEVLQIPTNIVVGGDFTPNVEGIARLDPDVVIQWGDLGNDLVTPLESAGIKVARYRALPEGGDATLAAMLVMLGEMTGDARRAAHLNALRTQASRRLEGAVSRIPEGDRQRVLILTRSGAATHASGGDAAGVYSYLIYKAGGVNLAETLPDFSVVGTEQIAAWNPDVIFLFGTEGEAPEKIFNDPILRSCKAAADRRVYVLPTGSHYWGSLGPDDALAQQWMAELLYPNHLTPVLRNEMRQTYQAMFDQQFSDDRLNKILLSQTNRQSAHYERFLA